MAKDKILNTLKWTNYVKEWNNDIERENPAIEVEARKIDGPLITKDEIRASSK